jgi:hypothetical protein
MCLALHPSGLHIIVGFQDSVRIMNLLDNHLVEYHRLYVSNCNQIKFSNGGHLFAIDSAYTV